MFYRPESEAGQNLRAFLVARGWDAAYHTATSEEEETVDISTTTTIDNDGNISITDNIATKSPVVKRSSDDKVGASASASASAGAGGVSGASAGIGASASGDPTAHAHGDSGSGNAGDYTLGAVIGDIVDYKERDWLEWLGVIT